MSNVLKGYSTQYLLDLKYVLDLRYKYQRELMARCGCKTKEEFKEAIKRELASREK